MCYMEAGESLSGQVGVRHLRQNLSVYLERVKRGEELVVTERGVAVARLIPLPARRGALTEMIAAGKVRMPDNPDGFADLKPVRSPGVCLSDTLREMRENERW